MKKADVLHIIMMALQEHIEHGCSAGINNKKRQMAIKITDKEGSRYHIIVKEVDEEEY